MCRYRLQAKKLLCAFLANIIKALNDLSVTLGRGSKLKRYITLALMVVVLALTLASSSLAVFPKPDGEVTIHFQLGWFNDEPAWYFCTDTTNIRFAQTEGLTLAPKLSSALDLVIVPDLSPIAQRAARVMYIVTNFQQGPVFSTAPGLIDYSGLWRVVYITWKPGVTKHPITNADPADDCNPGGIPSTDNADIVCSGVVLDCPIIALGQLACEWLPGTPERYRIPQVLDFDKYAKTVDLPTYDVFTQDPLTKKIVVREVVITDVSSQELADLLKANLAPGLLWMPLEDTQRFWDFVGPRPPTQLPVFPNAPNNFPLNTNNNYSPIGQFTVFDRDSVVAQSTTIKTGSFAEKLAALYPNLVLSQNQIINAPVVPLFLNEEDNID